MTQLVLGKPCGVPRPRAMAVHFSVALLLLAHKQANAGASMVLNQNVQMNGSLGVSRVVAQVFTH